jgi:hypothetical protein
MWWAALLLAAAGPSALAQDTNSLAASNEPAPAVAAPTNGTPASPPQTEPVPPRAESPSSRLDESAFHLVTERNIFNANRSGGQVRLSTRRPSRVESFKLVGTIAYEKGTFAFFEGSNSELTKVLKPEGVIAGHKLVDILAAGVKLEADGKVMELAIGSAMRREDEGTWQPGEAFAGTYGGSTSREDGSSRWRGRDDRDYQSDSRERSGSSGSSSSASSSADQAEVLKRLMERRERESQ